MMNHDGSQQYTFGYGLANTPQIQLQQQQQQQIQLQQHFQSQHPQQILQHQGNSAVPTQNVFQLQVGGNPAAPTLLQQNDNTAPMAQHGLIPQPVIHASISVSLDNSKSLQGLNNMEAMVYPQQNNGLKIITNSNNFMQQPEIHFQSLDNMGKSTNVFDGITGATQGNVNTALGKQAFSGWVQRGDIRNQYNMGGQNTLPSFGHLWSQFQQQKTHQVNIVQQQPQINQFQSQAHQFQSHHQHHLGQPQQTPQQFTVSGIQSVNSIQMIKVQPTNSIQDQAAGLRPATHHLLPQCSPAPVQNPLPISAQFTNLSSSPHALSNIIQTCSPLPITQAYTTTSSRKPVNNLKHTDSLSNNTVPMSKKSSKNVQRKLKSSHRPISSPSTISDISATKESPIHSILGTESPLLPETVRIKPSSDKVLSESGPPKVTVTLDSLANNLSQFPEKTDPLQGMKVEKVSKLTSKDQLKMDKSPSLYWQQAHSAFQEKKLLASNHMTSSTGSSLDRPSSEDSNFSSPPYSFTPPNSIDSVFSPPPFTKLIPDVNLSKSLSSDSLLPSLPSPTTSSFSPPSSSLSILPTTGTACEALLSPVDNEPQPSMTDHTSAVTCFTNALTSASCSTTITTTSVTSSSPRSKGDIAMAASVHSCTPLSSPGVSASKTRWLVDTTNTNGVHQKLIKVPYSWQRKLEDGVVIYYSPSDAMLTSLEEIREYLLSHDTCKCGLECPFQLEDAFVFDPAISNLPWSDHSEDNMMGNLCRHRREILAMAAFHQSQTRARQVLTDEGNIAGKKRDRKSLNSGDDFAVSPLKKLRTSITNAVNKHAMQRSHNNTTSVNSLSSSVSELESPWPKDDDVFYPISTTPLSSSSELLSPTSKMDSFNYLGVYHPPAKENSGISRCSKERRPKFLNENLVYSNHHPSQRFESKEHLLQNSPAGNSSLTFSQNVASPFSPTLKQKPKSESSILNLPSVCCRDTTASHCDSPDSQSADFGLYDKQIHFKPGIMLPNKVQLVSTDAMNSQSTFTDTTAKSMTQTTSIKCKSGKTVTSKCKKDKQKTTESQDFAWNNTCISSNSTKNISLPSPSSSVSFLENPTVFVAQQTAMINNSISLCNIGCNSPGPLDQSSSLDTEIFSTKMMEKSVALFSEDEGNGENLDTSREDDDDQEHKGSTDVESNKSFSDATENNDSAYLSQTGSDQEKSDTVDGLDCLSKLSDIYDFSSSEDQLDHVSLVRRMRTSQTETTVSGSRPNSTHDTGLDEKLTEEQSGQERIIAVINSGINANSNSKVKLKQNRPSKKKTTAASTPLSSSCPSEETTPSFDKPNNPCKPKEQSESVDKFEVNSFNSLNVDLSQLLASNNWNIPALQKVLAQHSAGDPERLRLAIQQVMTQITSSSNDKHDISSLSNNNNNNNTTQNVTVVSDMKQDIVKQGNCRTEKIIPSISQKNSMEPSKDESVPTLKMKSRVYQPASQNIVGCNNSSADSKVVSTVKGAVKQAAKQLGNPKISQQSSMSSTIAVAQQQLCNTNPQTSIILSSVKPQQLMSMNTSAVPPVSVNLVTNASKPLNQIISNIGLNQTAVLQPTTQQFLAATSSNRGATTASQLLNQPGSQNAQIINTLQIPGLNNPLVIANPIQQASPSSVAQLSPAMAAASQMIAQGQQQQQQQAMQQISPSFVRAPQLPKPCTGSLSSHHSNLATMPLDVTCSIPQGALTANVITGSRAPTITQNTAVANTSVYSAGSQPVFVIPQAKPVQPMVQLVGSSQTINPASGLQGEMTQLINQAALSDQTQQLQNIIAASGFNSLSVQQAWNNAVTLNAQQQQQQQQQLQLLQLQQLMLPVIQNQNQGLPVVSACPSQPNTLMNAVVPQQGLQINQVMDVKAIQQNLSPAAQGFNNAALSPVAQAAFPNQIQPMASPLTVQVSSAANSAGNPNMAAVAAATITPQGRISNPVNILQQNINPAVAAVPNVPISPVPVVAQPSPSVNSIANNSSNKMVDKTTPVLETNSEQLNNINTTTTTLAKPCISTTTTTTTNIPSGGNNNSISGGKGSTTAGKSNSKSKSKSKKSDSSKVKDPQVAKDEEHIANAVNQILAQAVQQQRELSLAAQNQPPPPPKSRNRKRDSQARARAALAKEQELGKIASISDDTVFHQQLQPVKLMVPTLCPPPATQSLSFSSSLSSSANQEPCLVNTSRLEMAPSSSSQSGATTRPPLLPYLSSSSSSSSLPSPASLHSSLPPGIQQQPLLTNTTATIIANGSSTTHQNQAGSLITLPVNNSCSSITTTSMTNTNNITVKILNQRPPPPGSLINDANNIFRKSQLTPTAGMTKPSSSTATSTTTTGTKKSGISLKEHLSSIVFSKDKESLKKKGEVTSQDSSNVKVNSSLFALTSNLQPSSLVNGNKPGPASESGTHFVPV